MTENRRGLTVVSLFSGAGGLDLAACRTGKVKRLFSTDSNSTFLRTVVDNIPRHFPGMDHRYICSDVCDLNGEAIRKALGRAKIDLLIGGPPCDDFTSFGRKKGMRGDKAPLVFEYARLVEEIKPTAFLFENVPFLKMRFSDVFNMLQERLALIGYRLKTSILEASAFGSPTMRKRLFLVGTLDLRAVRDVSFPTSTHGDTTTEPSLFGAETALAPYVLVADVLKDLPDVQKIIPSDYLNHTGRNHSPETVEHMRSVPQGVAVKKSYRYRAPWKGLCRSLTAGMDNSTKSYIHPVFHREMSVREYARIHGFPDSWFFNGTHHNGIKQVANSVPIPLGGAVLTALVKALPLQSREKMRTVDPVDFNCHP